MSVAVGEIDGVPVARVEGPLDTRTAGELVAALEGAVPNHAMGLVLDLTATTHLDSGGIHVLFDVAKRLDRRQQKLRLVIESESLVADVVAAVDLGAYAAIDADVRDAVRELQGAPH